MDRARKTAIALLAAHDAQIGRVCFRVARRLDPAIASIPAAAGEASVAGFMRVLEGYLRTGDDAPLLETVRNTVALRRMTGYGLAQIAVMSHTYLPVIRRVFLAHEPDAALANAAFGVVESQALPIIARVLRELLVDAAPKGDVDDVTARHQLQTIDDAPNPFSPVSVEDEITAEG